MSVNRSDAEASAAPVFDWAPYYRAVAPEKMSATLAAALRLSDLFLPGRENWALDLGCGEGRDTLKLLSLGWHVVAVDNCHDGIAQLAQQADQRNLAGRLQIVEQSFAGASWGCVDLVTAHLALPYCPKQLFPSLWQKIVDSLKSGGVISTQLFGERNSAAQLPFVSHVTAAELEKLLAPFEVIELKEVETMGFFASGEPASIHTSIPNIGTKAVKDYVYLG